MRPQRRLARKIEAAPPPPRASASGSAASLTADNRKPQPRRARLQDLLARHPQRLREDRAQALVPLDHIAAAPPPAPPRPARPSAAPPAGSCRSRRRPPAGPGTTAAAAQTTAGSRRAAPPARSGGARRLAASRQPPRQRRHRRRLEQRRGSQARHPALARMRLISRVASSEWPPSAKKLSSIPTRATPQHLGKQRAQDLLLRRARRTPRRADARLRRRQRPAVELAVRRQRQPLQHHERRRHHVVRQPLAPARARSAAASTAHPGRRHHIADQPLARPAASSRATTAACATPACRTQRRLDLARLDPEPAQLHLRVRPPEELQRPVRTPARQIPGPVHPAPRRAQTGRQQTAPPSAPHAPDSRAPAPHPRCKARPPPPPAQAASRRPAHRPACSRSDGRSAGTARPPATSLHASAQTVRLGRAVDIDQPPARRPQRADAARARQRLAARRSASCSPAASARQAPPAAPAASVRMRDTLLARSALRQQHRPLPVRSPARTSVAPDASSGRQISEHRSVEARATANCSRRGLRRRCRSASICSRGQVGECRHA